MSVLIKDMEKPKSCYAVDEESEYCPLVNADDDCILLLKKGLCGLTWKEQYSKCPIVETPEPCEDAVSREAAIKKSIVCVVGAQAVKAVPVYALKQLPSVTPKPFHNIEMREVLAYINGMPEDVWQEFTACLECRGWSLERKTAKWCGSDFA